MQRARSIRTSNTPGLLSTSFWARRSLSSLEIQSSLAPKHFRSTHSFISRPILATGIRYDRRRFCSETRREEANRRDENQDNNQNENDMPLSKEGRQELARIQHQRMQLTFTCNHCETRATKHFAKKSYQKGLVIVRCDGCKKLHLVADNLGWFGTERNIEEILAKKGQHVQKGQTSVAFEFNGAVVDMDDGSITCTPIKD